VISCTEQWSSETEPSLCRPEHPPTTTFFLPARRRPTVDHSLVAGGALIARDIPQPQVEDFGDYEEDDPVEEELVAWIESKATFQRFSHGITPKHLPNLRPPN